MSFPITCTACHKTFTISDEIYEKKVAGRVVTIKCKSCSQGIRVDGTKGAGPAAVATAAAAPSAPEPAPVATEPLWAVDYPDGQDREFTTAEVVAELERGVVTGTTLVWRDGMAEWLEVTQVPELAAELTKIENKRKAAALAAAKAAGPVHKPRAPMPTVTGLAGLPGPGVALKPKPTQPSSPELAKPRAQQPSASELTKPRAQQPSASELAKPRAPQPSAPALGTPLPKPRAQALSSSDDATPVPQPRAKQPSAPVLPLPKPAAAPPAPPPPMAAPSPFGAPPPAAPAPFAPPPFAAQPTPQPFAAPPAPAALVDATPPLPASVAKVVSRPPQPQPAFPAPAPVPAFSSGPALVADHATVEWPEAKKKTPLIVLGVIAAAAIIIGAVVMLGGKEEVPPSTPITAAPPSPAAPPAPTPASTPTPAATQSGADTASGSDPVATSPDPGATPGAGFAELFAAGARKAEAKGATVAPANRFDAATTKVPLAQAATDAQACKQNGGPTGKATVVVTFDPNGKVSSATITDPPFAGTATGVCISSAFKRASIAPFSGLPGTVSKTFSIL
ncbi:MAG TPA: GYF domain-containing protein [Polyangiaceae bacterium]|nr:GYF domain-containing protein [Polyangiaceae bacterium]